jgi:hypothetical protein
MPLGRTRGIGPGGHSVPSVRIMAKQHCLRIGQPLPVSRHAGYQGEPVAQPRRLVEGRWIGSVAPQQVEPLAARRGVREKPGDHRGDAVIVSGEQQREPVATREIWLQMSGERTRGCGMSRSKRRR